MVKQGKSICVFSQKGGVGKTVLSLNLAGVSSSMDLKTLIMDFDMYTGSISMILKDDFNKTIYHLTDDLLNNRYKKLEDYVYKYNDNIDILPSPKDPRQASKISSKYIPMLIEKVKRDYDIIIIDTKSIMDEVNIVTLDNTDLNLFIIDNDLFTLKNTRNLLNIFNDYNILNYKVLLNLALDNKTPYFTIADMKKIIGSNIDYSISKNAFIKDITSYLYVNQIPSLMSGFNKKYKSDYNTMKLIIEEVKAGEVDEEK